MKDERMFSAIIFLVLKEVHWMLSPMPERVQMVGYVIPVIVAIAITLLMGNNQVSNGITSQLCWTRRNRPTGTSISVTLDR